MTTPRHIADWSDRKYKNDHNDLMHLVSMYGEFTRCKGGRLVHQRYCCTHCGSFDPGSDCLSPKPDGSKKR